MPMPYYVSPEQMMQDKAEYAKKGIAKGRSIIAMEYVDGILLAAENPSASLHKISEIYDNIAFAGAGKYSEFENLRKAGIRHADLKGFMYSREDVTGRSLANGYSQSLGTMFSQELKPLEVEILVVQVGHNGTAERNVSHFLRRQHHRREELCGDRRKVRSGASRVERKRPRPDSALGRCVEAVRCGAGADGQSKAAAGRVRSRGLGPNPCRPKVSPVIDHRRSEQFLISLTLPSVEASFVEDLKSGV